MTDRASAHEMKALKAITGEWEHRSKLGGEKTFETLLAKGWIVPFAGYDLRGEKFSLTDAGRAAVALGPAPKIRTVPRLKEAPPRLAKAPPRIGR